MTRRNLPLLFLLLVLTGACRSPAALTPTPLALGGTPGAPSPTATVQTGVAATTAPAEPTPTASRPAATLAPPAHTPTIPTRSEIEAPEATLPTGFSMLVHAQLYRPTGLAFDEAGRLYATSFDGSVHIFEDVDGDGHADSDLTTASGFDTPLGVVAHPEYGVYVSSKGRISRLWDDNGDLIADRVTTVVDDLPFGLHQNDNLKFGPDGYLYIGVGSTCDACVESDPRSATIMRFDVATGDGAVVAIGMRNPYDLAFHPQTGALYATDNGRDDLGMDAPQEELNRITPGGDYGWPDCWDEGQGPACAGTTAATAFFAPHSSANSLTFYTGNAFPAGYRDGPFVAILGSWLKAGVTRGIMYVPLPSAGERAEPTWFARWDGMPLGLAVGPDGALYAGDYTGGVIYRISYGLP